MADASRQQGRLLQVLPHVVLPHVATTKINQHIGQPDIISFSGF